MMYMVIQEDFEQVVGKALVVVHQDTCLQLWISNTV